MNDELRDICGDLLARLEDPIQLSDDVIGPKGIFHELLIALDARLCVVESVEEGRRGDG